MFKSHFITLTGKYLSGTATSSEQQLVDAYLEKLEINSHTPVSADDQVKEAMWQQILADTMQQEPVPVVQIAWHQRKAIRIFTVAASITCLIGFSLLFLSKDQDKQVVVQNSKKTVPLPSPFRHIVNTSGKDESIQLADGSFITLANNSEVSFTEPFINKRDITLVGKAGFKVAKNKTKPFVVISQAFYTTALGTDFTVTAYAKAPQLTVRLYEGKVVVKAMNRADKRMKKDYYLKPGQEFIYSNRAMARVRNFNEKSISNKVASTDEMVGDALSIPANAKGSWHLFNNQPLGLVFDQLAELYDVKIKYNKRDVRKRYFVGRFHKSDSLHIILNYITTANRLTFSKKDDVYYINK